MIDIQAEAENQIDTAFLKDYENRINPVLMTELLAEAVPVIKDISFSYTEVKRGYCKSFLPLNHMSSNQHGTHQAMLIGMAGDYTGGLALASLIQDEPILGIHEVTPDKSMSLWLAGAEVKYLVPSTEDLVIEAEIDNQNMAFYNRRYQEGKSLFVHVTVSFFTMENELVARGSFRYYCKKKSSLTAPAFGEKANVMYRHISKTSAKLIARLRHMEKYKAKPLFIDDYAAKAAGKQGKVISDKFTTILPQLQNMVAARTYHLDETIKSKKGQFQQIVFVGVGLDFRMYRLQEVFSKMDCYVLDLPEMLQDRSNLVQQFNNLPPINIVNIPCNFITESISEKLSSAGFTQEKSTLYIFEGCSMYFTEAENGVIMKLFQNLLKGNTDSRLWIDVVDDSIFKKNNQQEDIHLFLKNIARLGEPFVYGYYTCDEMFKKYDLLIESMANVSDIIVGAEDSIYGLYSFCLLKPTQL